MVGIFDMFRWLKYSVAWILVKGILLTITLFMYFVPIRFVKYCAGKMFEEMDIFVNLSADQLNQKKKMNPKAINIKINDDSVYTSFARDMYYEGLDAFVDGRWDCDDLAEYMGRAIRLGAHQWFVNSINRFLNYLRYHMMNSQGIDEAWETGKKHYDFGNKHFQEILGPSMAYSCGYWRDAKNLDEAQLHKMHLIAKKLQLKPGMRVLDIGCGWGALAKLLAENYGVTVVGVTVSLEGAKFARKFCEGLPVEIRVQDYRSIDEQFDRIVCIEMMEHIGPKNYRSFFQLNHRCLRDDGFFLLQVVTVDGTGALQYSPWNHSNLIPNVYLPSAVDLIQAMTNLFTIEDLHNFGPDYSKTAEGALENFVRSWPALQHLYPDPQRVYRIWILYLAVLMGMAEGRGYQLWQVVMTKKGLVSNTYQSIR